MYFSLSFHKYQGLLSCICTSHIPSFPQSIINRIEMLHWYKFHMFSFGSGKKTMYDGYVTDQHVGDQFAQIVLGILFSLRTHRFPKKGHCNLTELIIPLRVSFVGETVMYNFCLFVCILWHRRNLFLLSSTSESKSTWL